MDNCWVRDDLRRLAQEVTELKNTVTGDSILAVFIPAAEIIHLLNMGSVKQLKSLQSVGEKRAQLIHSWRQMFGEFATVSAHFKYQALWEF